MKVICNTTPLIALSSIDQIGLLKEVYSSVMVPMAVIEEINVGGQINVPDLTTLDWIEVIPNTLHLNTLHLTSCTFPPPLPLSDQSKIQNPKSMTPRPMPSASHAFSFELFPLLIF